MLINLLNDIIIFAVMFSFINDTFLVEFTGSENILKILLILFFAMNIKSIILSFFKNHTPVTKIFLVFLTVLAISMLLPNIFYSDDSLSSGLLTLVSIGVIFLYFSHYKNLDKILYFFWICMVVSVAIAFIADPITEFTFRKTGGTGDPNEFASQLLAFIFISVYLFLKNKNNIFIITSLLLFSYGIISAGSKTSMLVLFILLLYIAYIKFKKTFLKLFSFKGIVGILVLIAIATQFDFSKIEAVAGFRERAETRGTLDTRLLSWKAGAEMIKHNFFTGVGFDAYPENTRKYLRDYIDEGSIAPHNIYIKLFAESGIFTFIVFLTFIFYLVKIKYPLLLKSNYFWIQLVALSYLMMGMGIGNLYDKYFWLGLALLSNVIVYYAQREEKNENSTYPG